MSPITYRQGNDLDLDEVLDLYRASTLGQRRPAAVDYYPKIGFTQHGSAWILRAGEALGASPGIEIPGYPR